MVALHEAPPLPAIGEVVRVAWGLASVAGRVIETYAGVRPRVVVEIDAGEVDDLPATVTVPASALNPVDSSTSDWANAVRYEQAVADALLRVNRSLKGLERNATRGGGEVDVVAYLEDGRQLVVETKNRPITEAELSMVLVRMKDMARELGASWLVVTPELRAPKSSTSEGLNHVAVWIDERDDDALRRALLEALSA